MVADHPALFAAAADPQIWEGHPAPDRYLSAPFQHYFDALIATRSTLAIIDTTSDEIIGCSAYYTAPDRPNTISIGFTFLQQKYWGGATNFAVKSLMLDHAYNSFRDVWFHIGPDNIRSQKATAKLGATFIEDATLNLGGIPAQWKVYRLPQADWQKHTNFTR